MKWGLLKKDVDYKTCFLYSSWIIILKCPKVVLHNIVAFVNCLLICNRSEINRNNYLFVAWFLYLFCYAFFLPIINSCVGYPILSLYQDRRQYQKTEREQNSWTYVFIYCLINNTGWKLIYNSIKFYCAKSEYGLDLIL